MTSRMLLEFAFIKTTSQNQRSIDLRHGCLSCFKALRSGDGKGRHGFRL